MYQCSDQIIRKLAALAVKFRNESLFPALESCIGRKLERTPEAYQSAVATPLNSARVFLGFYAFARAGGERAGYGRIACSILDERLTYRNAEDLLRLFQEACTKDGIGRNDKLNAQIIRTCFERHFRGEPASSWLTGMGQTIKSTSRLIPVLMDLLKIKGVGPKTGPLLCRDLVWAFQCETGLPSAERIAMQPIDTWLRKIGQYFWPDFAGVKREAVDVLLAGHIVAELDRLGVSGVDFNQGAWYFGAHRVGRDGELATELRALATEPGNRPSQAEEPVCSNPASPTSFP